MTNWWQERARLLAYSTSDLARAYRRDVDRWRRLARRPYPKTTGPLDGKTLLELRALMSAGSDPDRPGRWSTTFLDREMGNYHVVRYVRALETGARRYFGTTSLVPALHELVGREGYLVDVSGLAGETPHPTGAVASTIHALAAGASWMPQGRSAERTMQHWSAQAFGEKRGETYIL